MSDDALVKQGEQSMIMPDFLKHEKLEGVEHLSQEDVQLPRLAIAQKMSYEIDEMNVGKYIPGLKVGQIFNSLTREVYGYGPVNFVIVRADPPKFIEFAPREEGGGVIDLNVPANDPRTKFRRGTDGERLPPQATKFYEYIVLLRPYTLDTMRERMAVLSMKGTQLKVARQLNGLITLRAKPLFSGIYSVKTVDETNRKGVFKNFQIQNSGWITDPAEYNALKELWQSLQNRVLTIDRDIESDSFDPEVLEQQTARTPKW